ncbi:MAG TPA: sugar nucleotide-binding protein, partial [Pseudomonadales bacterium]|nr:sugar nucleotide-binding protein [Pseudomonadales bacterium]
MRVLLFGAAGQVGWELRRALAPLGELAALDRRGGVEPGTPRGLCGDLADLAGLRDTIARLRPDVIVNAAAYTAVDRAEAEPERAHAVNAAAPALMAQLASEHDALLVHYSTDYVFDGSGTAPWSESDVPAPLNQYGLGKRAGETAILESGCRHLL